MPGTAMPWRKRARVLAARREALVALAEVQRRDVATHWHGLQPSWRRLERGWQWWAFARGHAWAVLVPMAAVAVARPRWAARMATGLIALVRWQGLVRWWRW
jgi:hypothetical protein